MRKDFVLQRTVRHRRSARSPRPRAFASPQRCWHAQRLRWQDLSCPRRCSARSSAFPAALLLGVVDLERNFGLITCKDIYGAIAPDSGIPSPPSVAQSFMVRRRPNYREFLPSGQLTEQGGHALRGRTTHPVTDLDNNVGKAL